MSKIIIFFTHVTKSCIVLSFTLKVWKLMDVLSISLSQNKPSKLSPKPSHIS